MNPQKKPLKHAQSKYSTPERDSKSLFIQDIAVPFFMVFVAHVHTVIISIDDNRAVANFSQVHWS